MEKETAVVPKKQTFLQQVKSKMGRTKTKVTFKVTKDQESRDKVTTCEIIVFNPKKMIEPVVVTGRSVCNYEEGDTFDLDIGKAIAYRRAASKVINKFSRMQKQYGERRARELQRDLHSASIITENVESLLTNGYRLLIPIDAKEKASALSNTRYQTLIDA